MAAQRFKYSLGTAAVHAGEEDRILGAITPPIFQTSTFAFKDTRELVGFLKGDRSKFLYTRYGNPTHQRAETKIAELEGGEAGLIFSSGMAAIATAVLTVVRTGDEIVAIHNLYGGTMHLFRDFIPKLGIKVRYIAAEEVSRAETLINRKTKIFYFETPTNPTLKIMDIRKVASIARKHKLVSMIDNTFATPINQRPLDHGIGVVIHSGTKYLSGHADVISGAVVGKKRFIDEVRATMKLLGGSADPHAAYLLLRGLKTLKLRVEKANQNGLKISEFLSRHPKVKRIFYPGLTSHPQHELARSQMSGFGGMVCFEVRGGLASAVKVIDRFRLIANAASLGGVESLASLPIYTSHYGFTAGELKKAGVTTGMIRLSCGIEDSGDLLEDLKQALAKA